MSKINLKCNNKKRLTFFILGLVSVFVFTILVPIWFVNHSEFSGLGVFFQICLCFLAQKLRSVTGFPRGL